MSKPSHFIELRAARRYRSAPPLAINARLPRFIGGPADAPERLATLRVAIVGTGSVGGRIALHLARLGVAELWLVDGKSYKPESLLTHAIAPADIGQSKAAVVGRRCQEINPTMRVHVLVGRVEDLPIDAFENVDLVIVATDNLAAELDVSRRCRQLGQPLFRAALHGESQTVHVFAHGNVCEDSPCVGCSYVREEWELLSRQIQFPCDGSVSAEARVLEQPTLSVASLCGLAADLALNQVLRHVLKLGATVADTGLEFCGLTNRTVTSPLKRNADCPCDHRRYTFIAPLKRLSQMSPAALAVAAGFREGAGLVAFSLDGFAWVRLGACACPAPCSVNRFVSAAQPQAGVCPACRSPIRVAPFFRERAVSSWTLGSLAEQPFESLGAAAVRYAVVDDGKHAVVFRTPGS